MNQGRQQKINKAQLFHINQDYDQAVLLYAEINKEQPNYELICSKAQALISLCNHEAALKDINEAISLDYSRYEAFYHRGICNLQLKNLDESFSDFKKANEACDNNKIKPLIENYMNQIEAERNNVYKAKEATTNLAPSGKILANSISNAPGKITFSWYQTPKVIGLEILHAIQNRSELKTDAFKRRIEISFPLNTGEQYELKLDLFDRITPENTKVNALLDKIEIVMEKAQEGEVWKQIEAVNKNKMETEEKSVPVKPQSSYPTSSKTKKNWDKINKEIEIDMEKNRDDYGGGDAVNGLFSQIFKGSDDNTRKAMMKSFQQSGGKALSTNWDEVREKDYEGKDKIQCNDHAEEKKW